MALLHETLPQKCLENLVEPRGQLSKARGMTSQAFAFRYTSGEVHFQARIPGGPFQRSLHQDSENSSWLGAQTWTMSLEMGPQGLDHTHHLHR